MDTWTGWDDTKIGPFDHDTRITTAGETIKYNEEG